ncbi:MarR family winged helix-turn-helix transcriptional regulator [Maritalea porphyrae]|jgi:DNA-binding MarR family transcriptional regulator|uniref:MarR family winged helix-turn-helix transcriptional regulator n=1 Tax=Maritalea porphyrae TaxID=880732 RepID=UPI0022B012DA|nr:MarR family transcriptional regulator [Maritalea porphyrae]MCZ4273738.1 MarR family transcriptional regulator [Maritalea porphyrae]
MQKETIDPPADSLGRLVNITAARARQILAHLLEPHDLSPQQWIVLCVLWQRKAVSVGDLARYMRSEKPAVSRLVDRMEKAGWVKKCASCSDARSVLVSATNKGQEKAHLRSLYTEVNEVVLEGFSEKETVQLFALLNRAQKNASNYLKQK